jgi:hypothetical protein
LKKFCFIWWINGHLQGLLIFTQMQYPRHSNITLISSNVCFMATVNAFVYRLRSKVMIYSQDEKERERERSKVKMIEKRIFQTLFKQSWI